MLTVPYLGNSSRLVQLSSFSSFSTIFKIFLELSFWSPFWPYGWAASHPPRKVMTTLYCMVYHVYTHLYRSFTKFCVFRTGVVKNLKFEQNFQRDSNFLILPIFMVPARPGRSKISDFSKISKFLNFAKLYVSHELDRHKISNFSKIFYMTQISWFCQTSCFAGPGWSRILNLSKISNVTQTWDSNLLILPNSWFAWPGWSKISKCTISMGLMFIWNK